MNPSDYTVYIRTAAEFLKLLNVVDDPDNDRKAVEKGIYDYPTNVWIKDNACYLFGRFDNIPHYSYRQWRKAFC
jgi:hypothetical protein